MVPDSPIPPPSNPPVSPPFRLPLAERRRQILQTAVLVFARQGFHQTGMRQLCAELGMSAGALYRYFPGKEAIIAGLVELDRETIQQNLGSLPEGIGFFATLHHMMEVTLCELQMKDGLLRIWSEISAEATRNPAVASLLAHHYRFIESRLAQLVADGVTSGELQPGLDPQGVARFVMAIHEGMLVRLGIDADYPLRQAAADSLQLLEQAVRNRSSSSSTLDPTPQVSPTGTRVATVSGKSSHRRGKP